MTHTFDSGGFFTFLVVLAHGAAPLNQVINKNNNSTRIFLAQEALTI